MTPFEQEVEKAIAECYPPRISGESDVDYHERARVAIAIRVAALIDFLQDLAELEEHRQAALAQLRRQTA